MYRVLLLTVYVTWVPKFGMIVLKLYEVVPDIIITGFAPLKVAPVFTVRELVVSDVIVGVADDGNVMS